jgi:sugar phosphate isomerase/epimerase
MKLGLITDSVGTLTLEEALDLAASVGLDTVEIATGNWSEAPHVDLEDLVANSASKRRLATLVESRGLTLSAFTANGNQLHPVTGAQQDRVVRSTIDLASDLGVPTVVLMSGLPAAKGDTTPNWITTSWPPETLEVLDYQWNEVAIPYWVELAQFARSRGVRLAVEMCGAQLVFNVATMLALREAAGPDVVGANLDPSHLMWMGADILTVVRALGPAIFHVHAKDVRIERHHADVNGLLDTLPPTKASDRAWNYVTLGLGHPGGTRFWADLVYALRSVGYEGSLNIEHEDVLMGSVEGVRRSAELLRSLVIRDPADWTPAQI